MLWSLPLKPETIIIVAVFLALLFLETLSPLRRPKRAKGDRFLVNILITALSFGVGVAVVRPAALFGASTWAEVHTFGFLPWSHLPFWVQFVLGFLWMDLTFYWWHRMNHVYPLLWRFHNVHHIDPDMDVSTAFRFHFVETFYSTVFRVLQVGVAGVVPFTYLIYELIFNVCTMFHHSNLRLPLTLERLLNKIIVTPRMHGLHHSAVGGETNSNYSVVFRWWDFLHRTLRLNVSQKDVVIGVPGYLLPQDNALFHLITMPFAKQRPYWRWPSGKASTRKPGKIPDTRVMVV
jgi:sterol desaturase/sphingolipid hydroxylase (fatty acid hydroxylase superfamily)